MAAGRGRRCTRPQTYPPWSKPRDRRSRARLRAGRIGVKSKPRLSEEACVEPRQRCPLVTGPRSCPHTPETAVIPRSQPGTSQIPCPNSTLLSRPGGRPQKEPRDRKLHLGEGSTLTMNKTHMQQYAVNPVVHLSWSACRLCRHGYVSAVIVLIHATVFRNRFETSSFSFNDVLFKSWNSLERGCS